MKILGGIGYILSLIPIANFVAPILIGIAWFQAGSRSGQTIFRATGVLFIVTYLAALGLVAFLFGTIFSVIFTLPFAGDSLLTEQLLSNLLLNVSGFVTGFIFLALVVGVLGLTTIVLELVSHFRAADVFRSAWFRRAGWLRIITIILIVVFVVGLVVLGLTSPLTLMVMGEEFLGGAMLLFALPLIIVGLLSSIFSAVAFFTAESL
ncbi:MAG: hypothetical protein NZ921_01440 [Candidatus Caldarchaeum sp.]|nr:hypothetical protein [Candidatus Caldarchaeum sp.]